MNQYQIENTVTDFPVLASLYNLELHKNTPFDDEQWIFIGLADKNKLEAYSTNFITTLHIIFFSAILDGAILAFLVGKKLAQPIYILARKVQTDDIKTILSLSKTKCRILRD